MPPFLEDTLSRKIVFFTGKGGVGKTSVCLATAIAAQRAGKRVRVARWAQTESDDKTKAFKEQTIRIQPLDTLACFKEYALQTLKFERLYDVIFDNFVLRTLVRTAPGISDSVIAGKIWDMAQEPEVDLLLVDLPSSGHTLSFFSSPVGVSKLFRMGFVHTHAEQILAYFKNPQVRLDFVCLPEELPLRETEELATNLRNVLPLNYGFVLLNQMTPRFTLPEVERLPSPLREALQATQTRLLEDENARKNAARTATVRELPRLAVRTQAEVIEGLAKELAL